MNKPVLKNQLSNSRIYLVLMKIRPFAGTYAFLFLCILVLIGYALYTCTVIDRLQAEAVAVTRTYAELIRTAISDRILPGEINTVFEEIINKSNHPIIVTDTLWNPVMWKNIPAGGLHRYAHVNAGDTSEATRTRLAGMIRAYRNEYEPKPLHASGSNQLIGYLVFGNNRLVSGLKLMPFVQIGVIAAFLAFAYIAFQIIRVTERGNLWVALAKETAHQLGTPISSLMGWVELMKETSAADEHYDPAAFLTQVHKICEDMENDLKRLRIITNRFSQIGSLPALTPNSLNEIVEEAMKYLGQRLPLLRKRIRVTTAFGELPPVRVNRDLLEWVFENMMKNAIDAITRDDGLIEIKTEYIKVDNLVRVTHRDNGVGISWEDRKRIFSPGFTSKKRGWGLGLTLAKRIVEDYHKGRIYVAWSQKGRGTVFCVDLPVVSAS